MTDQAEIVARWLGWERFVNPPHHYETYRWVDERNIYRGLGEIEGWRCTGEILTKMRTEPRETRRAFDQALAERTGMWIEAPEENPGVTITWERFHKLTPELVLECATEVVSHESD